MDSSSSSSIVDEEDHAMPSTSSGLVKEEVNEENKETDREGVVAVVKEGPPLLWPPRLTRSKTKEKEKEKKKKTRTITCPDCGMLFSKPGNRNKHIRKQHGYEPELNTTEKREKWCADCGRHFESMTAYTRHRTEDHGSLFCPIEGCNWRGTSHRGLGGHAREVHATEEKKFEWKKMEFMDKDEFILFIRKMYDKGHLWYIRNGNNSKQINKIEYRYCHREDRRMRETKTRVRIRKKGKEMKRLEKKEDKEKLKKILGVERTDECCTSYMRVKWRTDGGIEIEYCLDHLAHDPGTSLPLLPEHKEEIREILEREDDPERVCQYLRAKYGEGGGRLSCLEEEAVRMVMREEVDPFGEKETRGEDEEREEEELPVGGTACITMEFSPSPSNDDSSTPSSALLNLLGDQGDATALSIGQLVATSHTPSSTGSKRKAPRFKLLDNGYTFRFDKNSVCGERQFWRCERKSDCVARIHTDMKGTILKRINNHSHPCNTDPDQVYHPKKKARLSPSNHLTDLSDSFALPYPSNHLGESDTTFSQTVDRGLNGLFDTFVKEEDNMEESILNHHEGAIVGSSGIGNVLERNGIEESEDFWKMFHLTKKMYEVLKKEAEKNKSPWSESYGNSSFPSIRVYVASEEETSPIYKMISLSEGSKSLHSFREGLISRKVLDANENTTLCVNDGRLTVELCDEILDEWKEDRVFRYRRHGDHLILEPAQ